jgi:ABC-type transport system substrate-binding protein
VYAEEVWDARAFDAFLGPMPPVHTPNAFLFGLLHSRGRWGPTGYSDADLDSLIEAQAVAQEGRGELIRQLQTRVLEQAVLFTPITGTSLWAWQDRIEAFHPTFGASEYLHWARLTLRE